MFELLTDFDTTERRTYERLKSALISLTFLKSSARALSDERPV
jgi:hypothetical protein